MTHPSLPVLGAIARLNARLPARAPGIAALLGAATIWGSSAVTTKAAIVNWPPLTLAFVRWSIALALLYPLMRRTGARPARGGGVALLGLTGLLLFYAPYSWGLQRTTAANGTLIGGATPVIVALISYLALGERIGRRRALGIAASLAGVTTIVVLGGQATVGSSVMGNLLMVASSASWATYTVVSRRVSPVGGALATVVGTAIHGLLFLAPFAAVELAAGGIGGLGSRDLLLLLYLALGPSAAAYLLWGYGLARIEASQAAVYGNLMPLVGVVLAVVFLDESLTAALLAGGSLVVLGVWLATTGGPRSED